MAKLSTDAKTIERDGGTVDLTTAIGGKRATKGEFRFANERRERDEPIDLPSPLRARVN